MSKKITDLTTLATPDSTDVVPLVDISASTTKKTTVGGLLLDASVTTIKVADDAVTARKIDWAATGADAGIWWEELGRTTLSVAGDTISVASLPARKYLQIRVYLINSGSIAGIVRFNNDATATYAARLSDNFGAASTVASSTGIGFADTGVVTVPHLSVLDVVNVLAQEKLIQSLIVGQNTAGAASAPTTRIIFGKWANTAAQITRVDVINTSTGDFAIGSEVVVLGHN